MGFRSTAKPFRRAPPIRGARRAPNHPRRALRRGRRSRGCPIFSRSCLPILAGAHYAGLVVSSPFCRSALPQRACGVLLWGLHHRRDGPSPFPFPEEEPYLATPRRGLPYTEIRKVLRLGLTYQTLLRMRADSFLPGSSGDVLRGWRSSAFLVGEEGAHGYADAPQRRDTLAFHGR